MPRLFTYTIPVDDGAAPNPFHGVCTLAICKPAIRSVARPGDWVAGLGSINAPSGNLSGRLVYAMRVEESISFEAYDVRAPLEWPGKIPDINSRDLSRRLGDCIYWKEDGEFQQRKGVHGPGNVETDLGGNSVLISRDFYYFGSRAIRLPDYLLPICHQTQGHRSNSNDQFFDRFVSWIRDLDIESGQLYGWPDHIVDWGSIEACGGCFERELEENTSSSF